MAETLLRMAEVLLGMAETLRPADLVRFPLTPTVFCF
jgi:hypothetical protein